MTQSNLFSNMFDLYDPGEGHTIRSRCLPVLKDDSGNCLFEESFDMVVGSACSDLAPGSIFQVYYVSDKHGIFGSRRPEGGREQRMLWVALFNADGSQNDHWDALIEQEGQLHGVDAMQWLIGFDPSEDVLLVTMMAQTRTAVQ